MFGFLEFFTYVNLPSGGPKRVRLAKIYCERCDADEKFFEFRKANEEPGSGVGPADIHAEFKFTEYLG